MDREDQGSRDGVGWGMTMISLANEEEGLGHSMFYMGTFLC